MKPNIAIRPWMAMLADWFVPPLVIPLALAIGFVLVVTTT